MDAHASATAKDLQCSHFACLREPSRIFFRWPSGGVGAKVGAGGLSIIPLDNFVAGFQRGTSTLANPAARRG